MGFDLSEGGVGNLGQGGADRARPHRGEPMEPLGEVAGLSLSFHNVWSERLIER